MSEQLELKINDGGRSKYFKADNVGDCCVRAHAIAASLDYKVAYDTIKSILGYSPRNGVKHKDVKPLFSKLGYQWIPCMSKGTGIQHHLIKGEVPMSGSIICRCSRHCVAVVNGIVNDSYDSRRGGMRGVYGYWTISK